MKKILFLILCLLLSAGPSFAAGPQDGVVYIAKYKGDKRCAISYTFDDGYREHFTLVFPQLEKNGFKGTFWVNGHSINEDENSLIDTTRMSWKNLKEMAQKGHEISNHSWSHKKLVQVSLEEVKTEIAKNDCVIFEKTGIFPRTFCYPYNARNEDVTRLASAGRIATRTTQFGIGGRNSKTTPEKLDQKVSELLGSEDWGVAMIHGITYDYDAFYDPAVLWNHWEKVRAMENTIWVGTFRAVASYINERNHIKLKVEETKNGLMITPELPLSDTLYTEPLTAVVRKEGIKRISVKQNNKELAVQLFPEKVLFDFDPFGGPIRINLKQ